MRIKNLIMILHLYISIYHKMLLDGLFFFFFDARARACFNTNKGRQRRQNQRSRTFFLLLHLLLPSTSLVIIHGMIIMIIRLDVLLSMTMIIGRPPLSFVVGQESWMVGRSMVFVAFTLSYGMPFPIHFR